jgi:anti-sigma B factor antagonist
MPAEVMMTTTERQTSTGSSGDRSRPRFSCQHLTRQGLAIVELRGGIDLETAPTVRAVLLTALRRASGVLLIEMSQVSHVDSTGLGALVAAHRRAEALGREVGLVAPPRTVRKLLTITGLDRLFPLHDQLPPAVD